MHQGVLKAGPVGVLFNTLNNSQHRKILHRNFCYLSVIAKNVKEFRIAVTTIWESSLNIKFPIWKPSIACAGILKMQAHLIYGFTYDKNMEV